MKPLVIVVAALGMVSATTAALAAGGRPTSEKVFGTASIPPRKHD